MDNEHNFSKNKKVEGTEGTGEVGEEDCPREVGSLSAQDISGSSGLVTGRKEDEEEEKDLLGFPETRMGKDEELERRQDSDRIQERTQTGDSESMLDLEGTQEGTQDLGEDQELKRTLDRELESTQDQELEETQDQGLERTQERTEDMEGIQELEKTWKRDITAQETSVVTETGEDARKEVEADDDNEDGQLLIRRRIKLDRRVIEIDSDEEDEEETGKRPRRGTKKTKEMGKGAKERNRKGVKRVDRIRDSTKETEETWSSEETSSMVEDSSLVTRILRTGKKRERDEMESSFERNVTRAGAKKRGKRASMRTSSSAEKREDKGAKREDKEEGKGKRQEEKGTKRNTRLAEPRITPINMEALSSSAITARIGKWLDDLEDCRAKSPNIKGEISGLMKLFIARIREGVTTLGLKAEEIGDPHTLRVRNKELFLEKRKLEEEIASLKKHRAKPSPVEKERGGRERLGMDVRKEVTPAKQRKTRPMEPEEIVVIPDMGYLMGEGEETMDADAGKTRKGNQGKEYEREVRKGQGKGKEKECEVVALFDKQIEEVAAMMKRMQEIRRSMGTDMASSGVESGGEKPLPKRKPRIVSNVPAGPVKLVYETSAQGTSEGEQEWTIAGKGGRKGKENRIERKEKEPGPSNIAQNKGPRKRSGDTGVGTSATSTQGGRKEYVRNESTPRGRRPVGKTPNRRPPKTAAVAIKPTGGNTYASVLRKAREEISLEGLGISGTKVRRANDGRLLIEIPGEKAQARADELANCLRRVLGDEASIGRPAIQGELRIFGVDDSTTTEEIREVLAQGGDCRGMDIRVGEIRRIGKGAGVAWAQCPLASAIKIAKLGTLRIGWTMVKVTLLNKRPTQCYKCWGFGHMKAECRGSLDRRGCCFRCGGAGHLAKGCEAPVACVACKEMGLPITHRMGGPDCVAARGPNSEAGRNRVKVRRW